jgi:hypothetical protein
MMAKVDRSKLPLFCGLTFPDEFFPYIEQPAEWKKILRRFLMRFHRRYPDGALFWRLELQARKSGKHIGAIFPHFHLLVYNVEFTDFMVWIKTAWWESCGRLSDAHLRAGTSVTGCDSVQHVTSYVAKYLAKPEAFKLDVGRVWGVHNVEKIPWVNAILCVLDESEAVQLIRYMRRYAKLKGRDYHTLTCFMDAEFWWRSLDRLLHPY